MKLLNIEKKKKVLFKNTIMLYVLTFSNYFFSFITVPYQTRVLGPEFYGKLGFALAFMVYFQLLIDYGFILSATQDVAENRDDKEELSKIVISVTVIKVILTIISFILLTILCLCVSKFREDILLYMLCFFGVAIGSLLPDYLYRGLEQMTIITVRTVIIKLFFTAMVFLLVKNKDDYYIIPVLNLLGNAGAVIGVYIHVAKTVGIRRTHVKRGYIWNTFKKSSSFFYSRIATTVYGATNTFLLGFIYPTGSAIVGLYTSSDKLVSTARSCFSPIADSLYPYMVKNRDMKIIKKILLILMPPVIIGCFLVGNYAEDFCAILLGENFRSAGKILKLLLPIVAMTPLTYILGFPVMTPMGIAKYCNISIIIAASIHLISLGVLFMMGRLGIVSLCYITNFTELIIILIRSYYIYINRKKLNYTGA